VNASALLTLPLLGGVNEDAVAVEQIATLTLQCNARGSVLSLVSELLLLKADVTLSLWLDCACLLHCVVL
jgi:hypothetical protein